MGSSAHAENCTPITNKGRGLPVYDQGQTSMCYAFTATQIFDAYRRDSGQKVPPLTSASEIAFRYTAQCEGSKKWEDVQGGHISSSLQALLNAGGCPYLNTHDFNVDMGGDRWAEFEKLAKLRRDYYKQDERIDQGQKKAGFFSSLTPQQKQQQLIQEASCSVGGATPGAGEIGLDSGIIKNALDTGTTMGFFKKFFEKGCDSGGRLKSSGNARSWAVSSLDDAEKNRRELRTRIDRALESPRGIPGIAYCPGVLHSRGTDDLEMTKTGIDCVFGESHASVVVGRRPGRTGACEYLVRNTYGLSCNGYPWDCANGQIWIPENELFKNTLSAVWIE